MPLPRRSPVSSAESCTPFPVWNRYMRIPAWSGYGRSFGKTGGGSVRNSKKPVPDWGTEKRPSSQRPDNAIRTAVPTAVLCCFLSVLPVIDLIGHVPQGIGVIAVPLL